MSGSLPGVAALAAVLAPARAEALLARHPDAVPAKVRELLDLPGEARLLALAASFGRSAEVPPARPEAPAAPETLVRVPVAGETGGSTDHGEQAPAWPVLAEDDVLPFDLPPSAPALAQVDPPLRELGARMARLAAAGIASVVGGEASVEGRLLPGLAAPAGTALVPVELTAIAGIASLAVERAFAARLAARVADAPPDARLPASLSPAERAVVELAVLGALEAIASETEVEPALAPRLAVRGGAPLRPLCIELTILAAGVRGRALLALPEAALRALRAPTLLPASLGDVPVEASVAVAEAALGPEEAAALRPGDVILLDATEAATLRVRGGPVARGRIDGGEFEVAEVEGGGGTSNPVPVVVELAQVSVSVAELARIAPGAVLPLGLDRSGRVTIRIGNRIVAHGALVEADGAVGVRILAPGGAR